MRWWLSRAALVFSLVALALVGNAPRAIATTTMALPLIDVREYGAKCDHTTNDSAAFAAAFAAAQAAGVNTVVLGSPTGSVMGTQCYLATGISIPAKMTLQCLSNRSDMPQNASNVATGDHKTIPNSLLIPFGQTVTVSSGGPSGAIKGCNVIYKPVYDTPNPTSTTCCLQDLNVIKAAYGGTGVTFTGDGASFSDGMILGFSVGLTSTGFDTVQVHNALIDATKCMLLKNSNLTEGEVGNGGCYPILVQQQSAGLQHQDITSIGTDGSGHYQVTLGTACDTVNILQCPNTGDTDVYFGPPPSHLAVTEVESLQGLCSNFRRDSTTVFTCLSSNSNMTGTGLVTTGTTVLGSCEITGIGDMSLVRNNQAVSGTGIPGGATVLYAWAAKSIVWLDSAHCATAAGAIADLTFKDQAYTGANTLSALPAPAEASGDGLDLDNVDNFKFVDWEIYRHKIHVHLHNGTNHNTFLNVGGQDQHNEQMTDHIGIDFEDTSQSNAFFGSQFAVGGNGSISVLNNQSSTVLGTNQVIGVNLGGFDFSNFAEIRGGNLVLQPVIPTEIDGAIFVADGIGQFNLRDVVNGARLTMLYQSATAAANSCLNSVRYSSVQAGSTALMQCPEPAAASMTAHAGGGQASATQITAAIARFATVATDHDSAQLPVAIAGHHISVINGGSHILDLYGNYAAQDQINLVASGTPLPIPARTGSMSTKIDLVSYINGKWTVVVPCGLPQTCTWTGQQIINLNGGATPAAVTGTAQEIVGADGTVTGHDIVSFGATPQSIYRRTDGTLASPTAVQSGDVLANIGSRPYDGTSYPAASTGNIQEVASENFTNSAHGTDVRFQCTKATTTTTGECFRIRSDGILTTGTIPVVTGTGSPTIATGSTDTAGEVTGGTSATSIIITFSVTKSNAPFCTVTPQTSVASFVYSISTTAITITETATTGQHVNYTCFQH